MGGGGQERGENINQMDHTEYSLHGLELKIEPPAHHRPVVYEKDLQANQLPSRATWLYGKELVCGMEVIYVVGCMPENAVWVPSVHWGTKSCMNYQE